MNQWGGAVLRCDQTAIPEPKWNYYTLSRSILSIRFKTITLVYPFKWVYYEVWWGVILHAHSRWKSLTDGFVQRNLLKCETPPVGSAAREVWIQ